MDDDTEQELHMNCADCAWPKAEDPSPIVGDDLCAACRGKADAAEKLT